MGSPRAFELRRKELGGVGVDDEAVARSFKASVAEGGEMRGYLSVAQLAVVLGDTLFVHGGITRAVRRAGVGVGAARGRVQSAEPGQHVVGVRKGGALGAGAVRRAGVGVGAARG